MNQPLSYIHPDAKIAANVVIEPFSVIHKNVIIEEGTWIGSHVTIFEGARIGKNCKIYPGASISAIPQDLKFDGEDTETFIGDNTVIRECVTISRGTRDLYKTVVGNNCLLMAYSHVAHDCILGDNVILSNAVQMAGHVKIDDFAIVSGGCLIHQFVRIGAHVIIAGGSAISKDVPPYTKASRTPISYSGINSIGLRRRGYQSEKINEIQEIYRYIYLKGYNNSDAMYRIEIEMRPSKERDEILNFMRTSDRGIMRGYISK